MGPELATPTNYAALISNRLKKKEESFHLCATQEGELETVTTNQTMKLLNAFITHV